MPSTVPERKKRKKKRKLMTTKQDLLNQLKKEKGSLHLNHSKTQKARKIEEKTTKRILRKQGKKQ